MRYQNYAEPYLTVNNKEYFLNNIMTGLEYIRFSFWNVFLLADIKDDATPLMVFTSTVQVMLGIVYVTVLVAIISRKFMPM